MSNIFSSLFGSIGGFLKSLTGGHPSTTQATAVSDDVKKLISEFQTALDGVTSAMDKVLTVGQTLSLAFPPAAPYVAGIGVALHSVEAGATAFEQFTGIPDADDTPQPAVTGASKPA
jgi:hypothetical protein